jgi:hypothetical protein
VADPGPFVSGLALAGLTGCSKSCDHWNTELEAFIKGNAQVIDKAKLRERCTRAAKDCPNLSSPYEVLGDLDIKDKQLEAGLGNYQKALNIDQGNKRIQDKIDQINSSIQQKAEQNASEARQRMMDMPLSEYVELDASTRMAWCEARVSHAEQGYQQIGQTFSYEPKLDMTPERLDDALRDLASTNPDSKLSEASNTILRKATRLTSR